MSSRINCHSAYVHYNMFHDSHCHGGGDIIGSVFNQVNYCNGGHTTFWGGLGAGLGQGLGAGLMGLLGGLTSCFSMMPSFMSGFNMMPPMFNFWGGGAGNSVTSSDDDYSEYSSGGTCNCCCLNSSSVSDNDDSVSSETLDRDNPKFAELTEKINNFDKNKASIEDYEELKEEIEEARKSTDHIQTDVDTKTYNNLLALLEAKKPVYLDLVVNSSNNDGYTDCDVNDLDKLTNDNVKSAQDVLGKSKKPEIGDVKANAEEGDKCIIKDDGKTIIIRDKDLEYAVEYNYIGRTKSGQLIYKDIVSKQDYILQKKCSGSDIEYHLMQYAGMEGAGIKAHSSTRTK